MTSAQRIRFWLIGLTVFALLLYILRSVLLPFVAGMAIAYFLDPVADRLERMGLSRTMATTLITLLFFMALVMALVLLAPILQNQILDFTHRLPDYINALSARVEPMVRDLARHLSPQDVEKLRSSLGEYAGTGISWIVELMRRVLTGGLAVVNILSLIFITPIVTFYLLRDWDRLVERVDGWLPRDHAATIRAQMREINRTLSGFVRGQATVCLALGTIYAIGLTAVGIEMGLVIGLISGILSFVPYLGTLSGLLISLAVGFAQSGDWTLPGMAALVFAIGNLIEGNVLTPKLVGDKVGLHPVWVMFALLAGGALVGFVGILLAVPTAAVIGVLARFSLKRYLQSSLYSGSAAP